MIVQNDNLNFQESVWKTSKDGEWKLFFNCDENNKNTQVEGLTKIFHEIPTTGSIFKLGSLVVTTKGIGRLIKLDNNSGTVKFLKNEEELNFPENEIFNEFPVYVRVISQNFTNWYRIVVPPNGTVESLKKQLEENKILDLGSNFYLVFNGKELRDDQFFDQIDLMINSKVLLIPLKMSPCKVNRFPTAINQWWYMSSTFDGIMFSANKKIKLTGVGVFGSHESKVITVNIKIIDGPNGSGNAIIDEQFEIPPALDTVNNITPVSFKKPCLIKPNVQYTAHINLVNATSNYAYTYYGSTGLATAEGEKKVEFTFTYCTGLNTSVENGLFPEFYYLC